MALKALADDICYDKYRKRFTQTFEKYTALVCVFLFMSVPDMAIV